MLVPNIKKVIVIGAGGTGSMLLMPLSRYLRSLKFEGILIIVDGDSYSESNAERQLFALSKVGTNKAEYSSMAICSQLPDFAEQVEFISKYIGKADIKDLVDNFTVVINCVDNNAVRKHVEDRCLKLNDVAHICCGNELSTGQVQMSLRRNGKQVKPSIYKQSPVFENGNEDRSEMDCEAIAKLPGGGQLIGANMMAASIALSYMIQLSYGADQHIGGEFIPSGYTAFNIYNNRFENRDIDQADLDAIDSYKKKKKVNKLNVPNR